MNNQIQRVLYHITEITPCYSLSQNLIGIDMVFVLNCYIVIFRLSVITNTTTGRPVIKDFKDQIMASFIMNNLEMRQNSVQRK